MTEVCAINNPRRRKRVSVVPLSFHRFFCTRVRWENVLAVLNDTRVISIETEFFDRISHRLPVWLALTVKGWRVVGDVCGGYVEKRSVLLFRAAIVMVRVKPISRAMPYSILSDEIASTLYLQGILRIHSVSSAFLRFAIARY